MRRVLCLGVGLALVPAAATHGLLGFTAAPRAGIHLRSVWSQTPWRRIRGPRSRSLSLAAEAVGEQLEIPRSSLVVKDEAKGYEIYLVGCLHGSPGSGRDVQEVMEKVRPAAVVLELCESRHKSLRKDLEKCTRGDVPLQGKESFQAAFRSWWKGMQRTSKKGGILQAALAGFLSAPFLFQRLGNFDPGLEFKTAMAYADASSRANPNGGSELSGQRACAVVLGDRDVQETLRRLGGALTGLTRPSDGGGNSGEGKEFGGSGVGSSVASVGVVGGGSAEVDEEVGSPLDWVSSVVSDAHVVRVAVSGPSGRKWPDSLRVFDTVWREREALAALLLPMMVVLYFVSAVLETFIGSAAAAAVAATGASGLGGGFGSSIGFDPAAAAVGGSGHSAAFLWLERLSMSANNSYDIVFLLAASWYMLRFFRLVIKERDDVLADSILKACREYPGRPVVAVLGLLHCNGVAEILRRSTGIDSRDQ